MPLMYSAPSAVAWATTATTQREMVDVTPVRRGHVRAAVNGQRPYSRWSHGDEPLVDARPVQVGAPDRVFTEPTDPVDVCAVGYHVIERADAGSDEALVDAGPVQVRAPDRVVTDPVDVCAVGCHAT